jgi:hypothetical protein
MFAGRDGTEIKTDSPVYVPPGSALGYGVAYVSAHPLIGGRKGNIAALDVNAVEGSSLYIRNLKPFTGGQEAYSVKTITPQDRQAALMTGIALLQEQAHRVRAILAHQSLESVYHGATLRLTLLCRFLAYPHLPGFRITGIRIEGRELLVNVAYTPRPRPFTGK